jgi:ABC-type transport system involved in cytochrome bd biosynthesis fused ATPase/permease subunit
VMDADLILVMDKGCIIQHGKHQALVRQDGIYRQIFEIQTRIESELEEEIQAHDLQEQDIALPAMD